MNPCFRTSPGRKRRRRAHHAIKPEHTALCPQCGAARRPHHACKSCGYLRPGLQVKVIQSEA
ncbi:MAG: 50S ribosomal protein L32 [Phycisphaerales bacterium]